MNARAALTALLLPVLLSGCVAAAIPIAAAGLIGKKMAVRRKPVRPAPLPPAPAPTAVGGPVEPVLSGVFADFTAFALREAQTPQPDRISMVLAQPVALHDPMFYACRPTRQTVLIDADTVGRSDKALAAALATLRAANIGVLWLGDAPGGYAALQARLTAAALIGEGDRIYAVEAPGDRKQTLRIQLAHDYCILAMLVADRSDADEMYNYLRDPGDAFVLDRYWGAGWFMAPGNTATASINVKD